MRLWSLHPNYLDPRGLVALWREALLAQAVIQGQTRGYTRHPQLRRFLETQSPCGAIAAYLVAIHDEATQRGYSFNRQKIKLSDVVDRIPVTQGQLDYESAHLRFKLLKRDLAWLMKHPLIDPVIPHPLFYSLEGGVDSWEKFKPTSK